MKSMIRGEVGAVASRQARAAEAQKAHRATIVKNVERRLQVARTRGDERLVKILEAELRQFA
jgi:hypothetical protein